MIPSRIEARQLVAMLRGAAAEVIANEGLLTQLDSAAGDGDHGATMRRAVQGFNDLLAAPANIESLLARTGELFLNNDGGASGGLLGAFFLGMGEACTGKEALDCREFAAAFECGLAALKRYTKAKPGDKTMLDALEPASAALNAAGASDDSIAAALGSAASAAAAGAAATRTMTARFGRAQHLGERTLGFADPGATTIACILKGFANGIERASVLPPSGFARDQGGNHE